MRKYYKQQDIQSILEKNPLNCSVSYLDREPDSPDNVIVYYRLTSNPSIYADDHLHIRKTLLQINHYHKKKLDAGLIEQFMIDNFQVEATAFAIKQLDTDYFGTYYDFEIFTGGEW